MSLRCKFLLVVVAAILATAALFVILHKMLVRLEDEALLLAVVSGLFLTLAVTLTAAYRSFVAKPLARIMEGAERLSRGDRSARVSLEGGDELAQLAARVDSMAHSLIATQEELERQVDSRTRDLRAVVSQAQERSRAMERANRELAEADRRKTEFLTSVSHELRTPLSSIIGFLRLLQDGLYGDEEERREFLSNAEACANHLLRTVTDVLGSARLEAGRLEVDLGVVDTGAVLLDVVRILEVQRRGRPVTIRIENRGRTAILSDEQKLRQVLVNLVSNALKFTEQGEVLVRAEREGDSVGFDVSDTGWGIREEDLELIFERFRQSEDARGHPQGGTGLGLAISRELVELLGGTLRAESEGPGKGARFTFRLPAAVTAEPVESPA